MPRIAKTSQTQNPPKNRFKRRNGSPTPTDKTGPTPKNTTKDTVPKSRNKIPIISDKKMWASDLAIAKQIFEQIKGEEFPSSGNKSSPKFIPVVEKCIQRNQQVTKRQIALVACLLATDSESNYSSLPDGFTNNDNQYFDEENIKVATLYALTEVLKAQTVQDIENLRSWKKLKSQGFQQIVRIGFGEVLNITFADRMTGLDPDIRPWIAIKEQKWTGKVFNSEDLMATAMAAYLYHQIKVVNANGTFDVKGFRERHSPSNLLSEDGLILSRFIDSYPNARNMLEALRLGNKRLKELGYVNEDLIGIKDNQIPPWEIQHNGMRDGEYGLKLGRLELAVTLHRKGLGTLQVDSDKAIFTFTKQEFLDFYDSPQGCNGTSLSAFFRSNCSGVFSALNHKSPDHALEVLLGEKPLIKGGNKDSISSLSSANFNLELELVNAGEITVNRNEIVAYKSIYTGKRAIPKSLRISGPITIEKLHGVLHGSMYNPFQNGVSFTPANDKNGILFPAQQFSLVGRKFGGILQRPETAEAFYRVIDSVIVSNHPSILEGMLKARKVRCARESIMRADDYRLVFSAMPEALSDIDFSEFNPGYKEMLFICRQIVKLKTAGRVKDKITTLCEITNERKKTFERDHASRINVLEKILRHLCLAAILNASYNSANGIMLPNNTTRERNIGVIDAERAKQSLRIANFLRGKFVEQTEMRETYRHQSLSTLKTLLKSDRPKFTSQINDLRRVIQEMEMKDKCNLGEDVITRDTFYNEYDFACTSLGLQGLVSEPEMQNLVAWHCLKKTTSASDQTSGFLSDLPLDLINPNNEDCIKDLKLLWSYVVAG